MLRLKDKGITNLRINFSGSGDSGDVDDVELYIGDHSIYSYYYKHSPIENKINPLSQKSNYITTTEEDLIKDESYAFIDESIEHMDWVNNDGGYGDVNIDLETMTADVNFYERTVEEYSWDSLSLFEE